MQPDENYQNSTADDTTKLNVMSCQHLAGCETNNNRKCVIGRILVYNHETLNYRYVCKSASA